MLPRDRLLVAAIVLTLVAGGLAALAVSERLALHFSLAVYLVATFATSVDLLDFGVRAYLRQSSGGSRSHGWRSPTSVGLDVGAHSALQRRVHLRPYAFVMSVFNAEAELDEFMGNMAPYRELFWIVDDGSTDRTLQKLRQGGWRCVEGGRNRKKPAAIRFLLTSLPPEIESVVVVDPDFQIPRAADGQDVLDTVIFEFQRSGMAALCPRITIKRDGILSRFQSLEYHMAFALGRRSLADHGINSGASIYRRSALEAALRQHTLSVYGEDLQTSIVLLGEGEHIYYDGRLVLETEGKQRWRDWFSQRVGWSYGLLSVFAWHPRRVWSVIWRGPSAAYHYGLYTCVLVLLMHPVRVASMGILALGMLNGLDLLLALDWVPDTRLTDPSYLAAVLTGQMLLAALALVVTVPRGERLYLAPVVPLYACYAVAHALPVTLGYANWLSLKLVGRRAWGDHYQDEGSLRREMTVHRADEVDGRLGAGGIR